MASEPTGALALLAALVLEDGRRWGEAAQPWQWADARAILEPEDDRRYHFLTRPRGASKTGDLGGVGIAALLEQLPATSRSYALAADRDQGALLIDSISGFVARTEGIGGALTVDSGKVTAVRSGASLEVLPADEASSWGIRPHLAIVDELAQWKSTPGPRRMWSAIFSALPKVAGSRLVVLTSAGDPSHWSHGVLERAKARPQRWRVSEIAGPCPWIDEKDLVEQRAELADWEYSRLHLNLWTESDDRLTSVDDLRACVRLDGPREAHPARSYVIGVDLGLKNDRTVVAVCSLDPHEPDVVALDRMGVWQGSRAAPVELAEVEAWLLQAWGDYGHPLVIADPYQAAQLLQRLTSRGVRAEAYNFTQQSVSRLALRLHQLIADHGLALPDDDELLDELANVRLQERSPGVYRLDHDRDKHDDRAIALALAAHGLLEMTAVEELVEWEPDLGFSLT